MNVLSLFNGISCGRLALERAGVTIDNYFSSEIDQFCLKIDSKNYPDNQQIGDVKNIQTAYLPKIDLLMGGSPCQGFSIAGKKLAFDDPRSALFFEFVRILKECKPKFFLLENVRMKKEWLDIITSFLEVEPILINSNAVSAQNRQRYYWTNIPNVGHPPSLDTTTIGDILEIDVPEKYNPGQQLLDGYNGGDMLNPSYNSQANRIHKLDQKGPTLCAGSHGYNYGYVKYNNRIRRLTPVEFERLQGLPDNFTEGVSDTQRYKACGNGWNINTLSHIFKPLSYFQEGLKNNT
jgi:DNA (cytosine-5)-methyltransferase 3A